MAGREPAPERVRTSRRIRDLVVPILGGTVRQIINPLHWKTPGSAFPVRFHTDRGNRKPDACFRDLAPSYVQVGLAVDPQTVANGSLHLVPGSHKGPLADEGLLGNFSSRALDYGRPAAWGYGREDPVQPELEPGDILMWHVDTVHGPDLNRSGDTDRCLFINGYVKASQSTRGHWAFLRGRAVPLPPIDVPVRVQREDVFEHPDFEFVSDPGPPRD